MNVIHGAHEPRVALEGFVGVTQVFEGKEGDGAAELGGGGRGGGGVLWGRKDMAVEGLDVEEDEEDGGDGEEIDEELWREEDGGCSLMWLRGVGRFNHGGGGGGGGLIFSLSK